MTPKPKPKNYSKILDVLNTPQAAKTFSPKTYIDLVGQYSRKAFDNGEISKKEYMSIVKPLFGDAGIMATEKIDAYRDELRYDMLTGGQN
jgi:plastocyanin domain-containing protein